MTSAETVTTGQDAPTAAVIDELIESKRSPPIASSFPVRAILGGLLVLQLVLGALMVWTDVAGRWPLTEGAPVRPVTTDLIQPGDQLRPFQPRSVPQRPGGAPDSTVTLPDRMERLEFRAIDHPEFGLSVFVHGPIREGDFLRFEQALGEAGPETRTILLHSPGGLVREALWIAELVRNKGLDTALTADAACISACPYILAGGVERHVSRRAWVGIHMIVFAGDTPLSPFVAVEDIQAAQARVLEVLISLGIDARIAVPAMATPSDQVYFLLEEELVDFRLATKIFD